MSFKIVGSVNPEYNPHWPPIINSTVIVHTPHNTNLCIGQVHSLSNNSTVAIILLINNVKFTDPFLVKHNLIPKGMSNHGFLALVPSYGWRYIDKTKLQKILMDNNVSMVNTIHKDIKYRLDDLLSKKPTRLNKTDTGSEAIYSDPSGEKPDRCNAPADYVDTSLLAKTGELKLDGLFEDKTINTQMFDDNESFSPLSYEFKTALLEKLNTPAVISENEMKIIVNSNIAIRNIIETQDDETEEGQKIVKWLMKNMIDIETDGNYLFGDLKTAIFNGYVHLSRKGIKIDDIITPKLVPDLNYFKWQYGSPIDYDTLKYVLFQSNFQKQLQKDLDEQKEAEEIFMQEYLIALQPEPKYQMWTLKRLIMAWYADTELQNNIRKIKVLINQWRSRADQEFNKKHGVLPSIVVYPRYGKTSARIVLNKLAQYFLLYQNIGWKCSKPSYCVRINDLIWYTNGSIDLKLYFRKSHNSFDGKITNTTFDNDYGHLVRADKLLYIHS